MEKITMLKEEILQQASQELENITRILIRACIGGQGSLYDFPTKTSREAKTLKELIDKICGICHELGCGQLVGI